MKRIKRGFTLAEVLITLGVIGVVAAISLPRFIDNMTERANSERHANIAQKVTQAMEQMRAHGLLNTSYPTTEAFVDELQNYLKIAKRCDKDHIADCWPTKTVTAGDGTEEKISRIKTGKNLQLQTETNNVGLILSDGASIILNYDSESQLIDIGDKIKTYSFELPVGGAKTKEFPYTSNITESIDFITDVNGTKGPNYETRNNKMYDIRSFREAKIKGCLGTEITGIGCVTYIGGNFNCISEAPYTNNNNCWAGAAAKCKNKGMELLDSTELRSICQKKGDYANLPKTGIFWTSDEIYSNKSGAKVVVFDSSNCRVDAFSKIGSAEAICVDK